MQPSSPTTHNEPCAAFDEQNHRTHSETDTHTSPLSTSHVTEHAPSGTDYEGLFRSRAVLLNLLNRAAALTTPNTRTYFNRGAAPILLGVLLLASPTARASGASEGPAGPFSQIALGVSLGTTGAGFEAATPLIPNLSLRGGADFLRASYSFTANSINYNASLALQSGQLSLDWTPFHGSFRVSPGVLLYNGSNGGATIAVPGGQNFTLNHTAYISSTTDPIHGNAGISFPKAGPRITVGFGNMLPRRTGKHFAWTYEFGFAYFGTGTASYSLVGTECSAIVAGSCNNATTDSAFQTNIAAERQKIQDNVKYARFYPILKTGLSWRF